MILSLTDNIQVVPARVTHIGPIGSRMRAIDALECEAMGRTPKNALRRAFSTSIKPMTAIVDGRPEAMFGVIVNSVLSGSGIPWFLGTDEVYCHGKTMLKYGPQMIGLVSDSRLTLRNLVSAENTRAIALLKRWGFKVEQKTVEVRGVQFHHFEGYVD